MQRSRDIESCPRFLERSRLIENVAKICAFDDGEIRLHASRLPTRSGDTRLWRLRSDLSSSQRGQCQFRLFKGDQAATRGNGFPNFVEKQRGALHHTAAKHDYFGDKTSCDQVGKAQSEISAFVVDGAHRPIVALLGEFANSLRQGSA